MRQEKPGFWKDYCKSEAVNKPSLLKAQTYPHLPLTGDQVFDALVELCGRNPLEEALQIRFFAEGKLMVDPAAFLPKTDDRSFHGWNERLSSQFKDYALVINRLEKYFGPDVRQIRDYMASIIDAFGCPTRSCDLTLFAGRYEKTPFGVHVDDEFNFYWPLIGSKTMRFWAPEYGARQWKDATPEQKKDYKGHIENSFTLQGKPGDLMAWPGNWWHVGEASEFNVSFTIPFYFYAAEKTNFEADREVILNQLIKISSFFSGENFLPKFTSSDTSLVVPEAIAAAPKLLPKIYSPKELLEALLIRWAKTVSTAGLAYVLSPQTEKPIIDPRSHYQAQRAIVWVKIDGEKICVACDGNTFLIKRTSGIEKVIKLINTLKPYSYGELLKVVGGKKSKAKLNMFLVELIKLGAVQKTLLSHQDLPAAKRAA